jgi:hypothetical protein
MPAPQIENTEKMEMSYEDTIRVAIPYVKQKTGLIGSRYAPRTQRHPQKKE